MRQNLKASTASNSQMTSYSDKVGAGPGSPSKKYPDATSHQISLHPIIPEETAAEIGSARSDKVDQLESSPSRTGQSEAVVNGSRTKQVTPSTVSSKTATTSQPPRLGNNGLASSTTGNESPSLVVSDSYGGSSKPPSTMTAQSNTKEDSTERNNSTAKSQKRQYQQNEVSRRTAK